MSYSTSGASRNTVAVLPPFGLVHPMGRSIRALSPVTPISGVNPCWIQAVLRAFASGFHCAGVTASVNTQYVCRPLPDETIIGMGSPTVCTKATSARAPSLALANGLGLPFLPMPQSTSIANTLVSCTLSCLRLPSFVRNVEIA